MAQMRKDNARDPEQLRRMEKLAQNGDCHFCRKDFEKKHSSPIIREQKSWFVTKNDFPYDGAVHQYLIVSKRHIIAADSLSPKEWGEFGTILKWLVKYLKVKGYSLFVRSGDMKLTGGSLDHTHFQFLVGGPKPKNWQPADSIPLTLGYKKKGKK